MDFQERTSQKPVPTQRRQLSLFARNFFKHPRMLGSIIPSSPFLVRRLLDQVDWERARVIVEYGPGVGTITSEILHRMHPEAVLVAVETNQDFVAFLRDALPDPRLHVVHGSAVEVQDTLLDRELEIADYVIAGIPFSTMPESQCETVLRATHQVLAPSGALLIYQFSPKVLPHLQRVFSEVRRSFEPFNVLPAQLYYCVP
ncbi:class I SAM-dependent methyltransferase [Litchfieldella rifensis]|uniref:Class I SAM-dependent methyltransferase n=1 Tax=Litchfieldella rifensis TaxID=762643 RepID=A0ABV7LIB7_9GAMM